MSSIVLVSSAPVSAQAHACSALAPVPPHCTRLEVADDIALWKIIRNARDHTYVTE